MCSLNVLKAAMCLDEVFSNPLLGENGLKNQLKGALKGWKSISVCLNVCVCVLNIHIYA